MAEKVEDVADPEGGSLEDPPGEITMEEATGATSTDAESEEPVDSTGHEENVKNLRKVGGWHAAAVVAALTLFGAAHTWSAASGWLLAAGVSIAAAVLAGIVVSSIVHEWGHFSGAYLSGSHYTVAEKPVNLYFMFDFDMQSNSVRQALWMSWGGVVGSWTPMVVLFALVPMDSLASAALVATLAGRAFNASYFEIPVILNTRRTREFRKELMSRLESPGIVQIPGLFVGLLVLAALT
ncbi:MAG: hypothetical protein QF921_08150 [Pseudomonadales bacterium]|jgi:hypothetical protein|nr:hypothetical protein [Pseudomonadales bacterium]MDP6472456.1 hypothetical protein [Pseudomonadales bacterium]MDP6828733.1 hypothetical protein [Pseudomonadales bacterium]MDP6971470.1 hypothetical protein [Pseudomonadales bacterium]|tara:strand:- start:774 stop:1487 length:714 start_codon:yes stop_codon:yes gene_type:complete